MELRVFAIFSHGGPGGEHLCRSRGAPRHPAHPLPASSWSWRRSWAPNSSHGAGKKRRMALTEAGSRLRWQAEEILALADKTLASFQGAQRK